jgi:putative nucleotidyltransferase with HDIG domain
MGLRDARTGREEISRQIDRLQRRLLRARQETILALMAALEARDPYTHRHSVNVSLVADQLSAALGLGEGERVVIQNAALLHDIGKLGIPDAILFKPASLAPAEMMVMRGHARIGADLLRPLEFLRREWPLVLHHHEWFNGAGYPQGLAGEAIPLGSRIIQVADSIDAMLEPRPYRKALSLEEAIREVERGRGVQFDPAVAAAAVDGLRRSAASRRVH